MKITAIEPILVQIPYDNFGPKWEMGGKVWSTLDILFVRVETDEGIIGWGEAFGHTVCPVTKIALETMVAPLFIGRDPSDIAPLMHEAAQKIHIFGRNGSLQYALSGIDIALWDIAGKRAGLPLYQLLGGSARSELPAYASLLRYGEPKIVAENTARAAAEGYRWIKLHEIAAAPTLAARREVGDGVALMLDTNCPWTVEEALEMVEELRPANLFWLEEPVWPPEDHAGLARVRRAGIPIAAGENAAGLHDFGHQFEAGALDIAQPSVTKIGGVTAMRKIIALAEAASVRLVPHCAYFGPGFLASIHIVASLPRETPLERLYLALEASPLAPYTEAKGGKIAVPQGPGLGCDPDLALIERYRVRA